MALIAPGVCRYTVNGLYFGKAVANIVDMDIDTTGTPADRAQACFDIAGDLINNWVDHILPLVVDGYSVTSVSWVDLDEEDGTTGERTSTSENTLPLAGASDAAEMPANVAMLVRKEVQSARGRRAGRMYLVGAPEGNTLSDAPNTLSLTAIAAINTQLGNLLSGLDDNGALVDRRPVVVHTRGVVNPSDPTGPKIPEYVGKSVINALTVDALLATQRRRLR